MLETRTAGSRQRWIVNRLGVAYSRPPECQGERDAPLLPSEAGDGKDANSVTLSRQIDQLQRLMGMPRRWRVTGSGEMQQLQNVDPKGSFLKNLVLSLLLIGVSSLLIPAVLKQIDDRKAIDQQQYQEQLARQDKIIDAQAEVLDTLAASFWEYEGYAADLLYSQDESVGRDDWHERAIDAYYLESGPVLVTMRAQISRLLRLAPRPTYESFLRLYEDEVLPLDSCLLELMKLEAASSADTLPTGCVSSEGKFYGASWDTLASYVFEQELAAQVDRELESLAKAFGLDKAFD